MQPLKLIKQERQAIARMSIVDQFRHLIFATPKKAILLFTLTVTMAGISVVIYTDKIEQRNIKQLKAQVYGIATGRLRYQSQEHPFGGRFYYNRINQQLIVTGLPADICKQLPFSEAIRPTVCELRFNSQ